MYDNYSKGWIYTLVVPDNFADLWNLPSNVISKIRQVLTKSVLPYQMEGPGNAGLFSYDNQSFILESFATVPEKWTITVENMHNLVETPSEKLLEPTYVTNEGKKVYELRLNPSTFKAYQIINDKKNRINWGFFYNWFSFIKA